MDPSELKRLIFAAPDLARAEVPCPEWGVTLTVQALDGGQLDAFEAASVDLDGETPKVKLASQRARLVALAVVDPATGARVFTDADVAGLNTKSAAVLKRLYLAAARLSGIRTGEDEPEKNSEATPPSC